MKKILITAFLSALGTALVFLYILNKPNDIIVDNTITESVISTSDLSKINNDVMFIRPSNKIISIVSYDWVPFHSNSLPDGGFTADLIREIFEPQGYTIIKTFYPWKRAQILAQKGEQYNAITEIYFNEERLKYYWFGAPYATQVVFFIALKNHPVETYNELIDLKNYKVGINRGASHGKKFDNALLNKLEVNTYKQGIQMLISGRIDFFVSSRSVAFYEARILGKEALIKTMGKPINYQYLHMAFSKNDPENLFRMQDYNAGLFKLHNNGRYKELLIKHKIYDIQNEQY